MISQDVHVLDLWCDMTSTVIDTARAQGVSERSELTPCITLCFQPWCQLCIMCSLVLSSVFFLADKESDTEMDVFSQQQWSGYKNNYLVCLVQLADWVFIPPASLSSRKNMQYFLPFIYRPRIYNIMFCNQSSLVHLICYFNTMLLLWLWHHWIISAGSACWNSIRYVGRNYTCQYVTITLTMLI